MRTSRPVAEKLGAIRQDPDLDGLLFGLISRATGGCHEHAARLDHIHVVGAGRGFPCVDGHEISVAVFYAPARAVEA